VNKADLNPEIRERIERLCAESAVQIVGGIAFDEAVDQATARGLPVTEIDAGRSRRALEGIWQRLSARLDGKPELITIRPAPGLAASSGG